MPYGQPRPATYDEVERHDRFAQGYTEATYTGQYRDSNTELMYYGARFYDPALGRFISPDSIVPDPGNPQALNRYSYVLNNPLKYTDPTGHYEFEEEPDDPWIYTDPQVRSAQYFTAPEYEQGQPSDAEIGWTVVGAFGTVVASAGASIVAEAAIAIGTAAVTMVGPSLVAAAQRAWTSVAGALQVASADGDPTNEVGATAQTAQNVVQYTKHALERMAKRHVTQEQVQAIMSNFEAFQYYHEGVWKTGYYDPVQKIMVATVGETIVTVINKVKPQYIQNLLRVKP